MTRRFPGFGLIFAVVLCGCEKGSNVNFQAPGISISANDKSLNISAHDESGPAIKGAGPAKSEDRKVAGFHAIKAESAIHVRFKQSPDTKVTVTAYENLLTRVSTDVEDGVLSLELQGNIENTGEIVVEVSGPNLDSVEISGGASGDFQALNQSEMTVAAEGGSTVKLEGALQSLDLKAEGAAHVDGQLTGPCKLDGDASGGSQVKLTGEFSEAKFELDGAAQAQIDGFKGSTVRK